MPTRRSVITALLAGGVGGATLTDAKGYLDRFAPLSGTAWGAATATTRDRVATPYGRAWVRYDDAGVPTVHGANERSLYFAVGYVQAADRLFEMDLIRRRMRGTLSAAVGDRTLDSDRFHAKMDFVGAARATWETIEGSRTGDAIAAYVDGVEAFRRHEELPLEFRLLGYEPNQWRPIDSLLVQKQIAWGLTGDFNSLQKSVVADTWSEDVAELLFPARLDHDATILRGGTPSTPASSEDDRSSGESGRLVPPDAGPDPADLDDLAAWLSTFAIDAAVGSNNWVVDGEETASGKPLLANDPHLTLMAPPVWYQMYHRRPGMAVGGVTFPGTPFVVIGQNRAGAWGFTNVGADVLDVYTYETRDGEYRYGDEWRRFDTTDRTIAVAGGDDPTVTVRKTVHGPVIEREGKRIGVAWTGLMGTRTSQAVHELDVSGGRDDALAAIRKFDQPTQNVVYADGDGNTFYYVTGLLPERRTDGEVVRGDRVFDGSARESEWPGYEPFGQPDYDTGWVPFEEKPHAFDPDYLASANQRVVDDPQHYIGTGYASPFRGKRIYDLLDRRAASDEPIDTQYVKRVQLDVRDERAPLFVPTILDARSAMDADARRAADRLEGWDYRMTRDSKAALVFGLFTDQYRDAVWGAVLAKANLDDGFYPPDWVLFTLEAESDWFRDPPAGQPRKREDVIATAMKRTVGEIGDQDYEVYGDYNVTDIDHPFDLGFLNYPQLPTDGSVHTVRNFRRESSVGSSVRLVARFDGDHSQLIIPGGNDGEYFSDHYDDQLEAWADGRYRPLVATTDGEKAITFRPGGDGNA